MRHRRRQPSVAVALALALLATSVSAEAAHAAPGAWTADAIEVTPQAPTLTRSADAGVAVALPNVPGVTYSHSSAGRIITVVAAPTEGHVLAAGAQSEWAMLVPDVAAALREVAPEDPQVSTTRFGEQTVAFPDLAGVRYAPARDGDIVTITAAARPGHIIAPGATTKWTLDLSKGPEEGNA